MSIISFTRKGILLPFFFFISLNQQCFGLTDSVVEQDNNNIKAESNKFFVGFKIGGAQIHNYFTGFSETIGFTNKSLNLGISFGMDLRENIKAEIALMRIGQSEYNKRSTDNIQRALIEENNSFKLDSLYSCLLGINFDLIRLNSIDIFAIAHAGLSNAKIELENTMNVSYNAQNLPELDDKKYLKEDFYLFSQGLGIGSRIEISPILSLAAEYNFMNYGHIIEDGIHIFAHQFLISLIVKL